MLLFIRKRFADLLRSGAKTLEIRAGSRYAGILPGHVLAVNGRQFQLRVSRVEQFATRAELHDALTWRYQEAGFDSLADMRDALRSCYPHETPPYTILHVATL
jgi:uncharacterized protein YqfB (UPF0267 family)